MQSVVVLFLVDEHRLLYLGSGGGEPVFYRPIRALHDARDIRDCVAVVVEQYHGLTLLGGQLAVDDVHYYLPLCSVGDVVLWDEAAVGNVETLLQLLVKRGVGALLKALPALVYRYPTDPALKPCILFECGQIRKGYKIALLHHVAGVLLIPEKLQAGEVYLSPAELVEPAEGCFVAARSLLRELPPFVFVHAILPSCLFFAAAWALHIYVSSAACMVG